jgi:hypothetical protein
VVINLSIISEDLLKSRHLKENKKEVIQVNIKMNLKKLVREEERWMEALMIISSSECWYQQC